MGNFAVIEDGKVTNTILCESKALAEEVTGKTCVEYTEANPAVIGLGYSGGIFEQHVVEEEIVVPPASPTSK
jgi:hypothetical protein